MYSGGIAAMSNSRVFIVFYFFTNLGLPCASQTPLPYTSHTPPIHLLPYTSHTPPIHLPYTSQTPPRHLPRLCFPRVWPFWDPESSWYPKTLVFSGCAQEKGRKSRKNRLSGLKNSPQIPGAILAPKIFQELTFVLGRQMVSSK